MIRIALELHLLRDALLSGRNLRILHSISSIGRTSGGPSQAVAALCNHLGKTEATVDLLTVNHRLERPEMVLPDPACVALNFSLGWRIPALNVRFCPGFAQQIVQIHGDRELSIIHDHGLWLPSNHASAKVARSHDIPLVISTHGMLEPWALKYRGWKKKIVWWVWQGAAIQSAALLHATAKKEADNLRELGLKNPIAIIPNGVDVPDNCAQHEAKPERIALFLSRIHPVKGLLHLVKAWAKLHLLGWKLVIAGPDAGGHQAEIQNFIDDAGLGKQVELIGSVEGDAKWQLYEQASFFVLPSFSENFGIVVAEALVAGVPVITTKGTPWSDLNKHACGWWIDVGVEPLEAALREAMALSDAERLAMGQRGRQLVQNNYSWPKIAADMSSTYRWVLEGGTPPGCVRLD